MDNPTQELAERVTELEIKASYADDLLDQLNMTVFRQQQQIERLVAEVVQLREQSRSATQAGTAARDPRDELPPHY